MKLTGQGNYRVEIVNYISLGKTRLIIITIALKNHLPIFPPI